MTPLHLEILMHHYVSHSDFEHPSRVATEYAHELVDDGLLYKAVCSGFGITDKGKVYARMILDTPQPIGTWIDPRNGRKVS